MGKGGEILLDEGKLQYLKDNGYFEVSKEEVREELSKFRMPWARREEAINKYKYYRIMSDGQKMFFSQEYLESHSIEELEDNFKKIS